MSHLYRWCSMNTYFAVDAEFLIFLHSVGVSTTNFINLKSSAESKHIWPVQCPAAICVHLPTGCHTVSISTVGRLDLCHTQADFLQILHCNWCSGFSLLRRIFYIPQCYPSQLPAQYRIQFKILTITCRPLHGQALAYLADIIHPKTSCLSCVPVQKTSRDGAF